MYLDIKEQGLLKTPPTNTFEDSYTTLGVILKIQLFKTLYNFDNNSYKTLLELLKQLWKILYIPPLKLS